MITQHQRIAIREVINRNFTFSDLSPRFKNVDSSTGNIFCPFHENHDTPAAKMYWNEYKERWEIHCFGECHRSFSAYDYVDLVLCLKYQKYSSPLEFLQKNMDSKELQNQLVFYTKRGAELETSLFEEKVIYINNVAAEAENLVDFIEVLYTS